LASALRSPKAQFIVLDSLQPLCDKEEPDHTRKFVRIEWNRVEKYIGDADKVFVGVDGKNEDEVAKLAVIGQEGDKVVGDLSHDEARSYFLNKVSTNHFRSFSSIN
jgi:NAD+ diphosphatase